jgi:hypothetical protein
MNDVAIDYFVQMSDLSDEVKDYYGQVKKDVTTECACGILARLNNIHRELLLIRQQLQMSHLAGATDS